MGSLSYGERLLLRWDGNAGNSFQSTQGKDPSSRAMRRRRGSWEELPFQINEVINYNQRYHPGLFFPPVIYPWTGSTNKHLPKDPNKNVEGKAAIFSVNGDRCTKSRLVSYISSGNRLIPKAMTGEMSL